MPEGGTSEPTSITGKRPISKTYKRSRDKCDTLLESIEQHFKKPKQKEDRYDILGKNIAVKLRDISNSTQKLIAEKLMYDALFLAEMGQLNMTHSIRDSCENRNSSGSNYSQFNHPPRTYENLSPAIGSADNSNHSLASYLSHFSE